MKYPGPCLRQEICSLIVDSRLAPIQRENSIQNNPVPHWLSINLESTLSYDTEYVRQLGHVLQEESYLHMMINYWKYKYFFFNLSEAISEKVLTLRIFNEVNLDMAIQYGLYTVSHGSDESCPTPSSSALLKMTNDPNANITSHRVNMSPMNNG